MSTHRLSTIPALAVAVATLLPVAPPASAQPPRFQSGVDVVVVDVNVVGSDGQPVATLAKPNFVLKVDGVPREIVSLIRHDYRSAASAPGAAPSPAGPSEASVPAGASRAPDRTFLVVLDRGNLDHGDWRKTVRAAQEFIDTLAPGDGIGVALLPASSLALRFDEPRAVLKGRLEEPLRSSFGWNEGEQPFLQSERRSEDLLHNLDAVVRALGRVQGPKHLVFVGADPLYYPGGPDRLPMVSPGSPGARLSEAELASAAEKGANAAIADRQAASARRAGAAASAMGAIAEGAALARVRIHSLKLGDSTAWTGPDARLASRDTLTRGASDLGIYSLASATGGLAMFPVAGGAFFQRLSRELSVSYALTFAPQPGEDDGKPHRIEVEVPNAGRVTVRARDEFVIPAGALKTTR